MHTIRHIAHRIRRLLAAIAAAVLAGLCPQDPAWRRCGVRIGR
ncbi:MAG: hypothetical protein ABFE13_07490 [Phycisphaerales bacterium]